MLVKVWCMMFIFAIHVLTLELYKYYEMNRCAGIKISESVHVYHTRFDNMSTRKATVIFVGRSDLQVHYNKSITDTLAGSHNNWLAVLAVSRVGDDGVHGDGIPHVHLHSLSDIPLEEVLHNPAGILAPTCESVSLLT